MISLVSFLMIIQDSKPVGKNTFDKLDIILGSVSEVSESGQFLPLFNPKRSIVSKLLFKISLQILIVNGIKISLLVRIILGIYLEFFKKKELMFFKNNNKYNDRQS